MIDILIIVSLIFVFLASYSLGKNRFHTKCFELNCISTILDIILYIYCSSISEHNILVVSVVFLTYNEIVILVFGIKKLSKLFVEFKAEFDEEVNTILAEYPENNEENKAEDRKQKIKKRAEVGCDGEKVDEILTMLEEKGL